MPSRDPPSHDDARPEGRWAEPPREAGWRESERRWGRDRSAEPDDGPDMPAAGGTFTDAAGRGGGAFGPGREPRQAGPSGGGSYGGSGGRASGSQAYGQDRAGGREPQGPDSAEFSQSVYGRQEARRPAGADWERQSRPSRGPAPAEADRPRPWPASRPGEPARDDRLPARYGVPDRPDDTQFDADYRQWREEQMRMLDRDYAQWRQERYRKFAEEFSQWRTHRLQGPLAASHRPAEGGGPASLGEVSPLGTTAATDPPGAEMRDRPDRPDEGERGGGLLSGLLGGHGDRHKPKP